MGGYNSKHRNSAARGICHVFFSTDYQALVQELDEITQRETAL
jgi:hypothetical protein